MGWSYPDISFEDMIKLIKGFVDMLILASGYRSSGLLAHWDADNIKRAFQWGIFVENVFTHLSSLPIYQDSVEELDAALSEMSSDPSFPQGLAHLSSATLRRAKGFILEHLIQKLPLRDSHLRAFLRATVEMDFSNLSETKHDCLNAYLNKLRLQNTLPSHILDSRVCAEGSIMSQPDEAPAMKTVNYYGDDFTKFAIKELFKRQHAVSCISTLESGLDIIFSTAECSSCTESDCLLFREKLKHEKPMASIRIEEASVDLVTWNHWKHKALSYFIDKRTVRLVSGSSLIFSGTQTEWLQVFGRLNISNKISNDYSNEMIELLLLGYIASRWNCLIEHLMSVSYDTISIAKQYLVLCNVVFGRSQSFHDKEESMNSKECSILDYLTKLLDGQTHLLWKLAPVIAAVALPYWSPLFRSYLSGIETQFKGNPSITRCCSCIEDRKEHGLCEIAERIWCLYIFHVCESQSVRGTSSA